MTSTEKKVKSIFAYLIPSFIGNILPLITLPIVTRILTPQDFGIVALAISVVTLIFGLFSCSIEYGTHLYYFKYRNNQVELRSLINSSLLFLLTAIFISSPIIYIFSKPISKIAMGSSEYSFALFIAYESICSSALFSFYLELFRNMEEAKKFSFFTTIQALTYAALVLLFIVHFKLGYMGLIYASLCSFSFLSIILFLIFMKRYPFRFSLKMLIESFLCSIQMVPTIFIGSIQAFFDKYLLRIIVSFLDTGIFSIAQNFSKKLFIFMSAVQSTFKPLFLKDMFDKGEQGSVEIGRNFTIFTYISLAPIILLILFGEEVIYLLAPPSYYPTINVLIILLCAMSTQTFAKITGLPLAYKNKVYLNFPISLILVIINVGLNILLIPIWGTQGAAFATLLSTVVVNAILLIVSQRFYKISYEVKILSLIYINIFFSSFLIIYLRYAPAVWLFKYLIKVISLIFFIAIGVYAKIISKKNMLVIINIFKFKPINCNYVE